ncbi:MAG: DUF3035 domain-containing protein [Acetobacteraceae bacterium]|nr:DUF3035 domain-containing protein [Acetobacteraceae bacterium]
MNPFRNASMLVFRLSGLALAAAGLTACDPIPDASHSMGLTRDGAHQFEVITHPPLQIPPDFSNLPPPKPVEDQPSGPPVQAQVAAILAPQVALATDAVPLTPGQKALDAAAGPQPPADIRQRIDALPHPAPAEHSWIDALTFWSSPAPQEPIIDPIAEAKRLHQPIPAAAVAAPTQSQ